ncbi:hypothetical protein [Comamonas thiooxydans]|uniref:hypothetical protein n=1 Tax=Comamonas thiooxydans TaxID=363952 RepID=UPI0011848F9D|nr:hypothetical protein [Comamonas thiooxydans]
MTACVSDTPSADQLESPGKSVLVIPLAKQLEASGKKYRGMVIGSVHIKGLIDEDANPKVAAAFSPSVQENVGKLFMLQDELRMAIHKEVSEADSLMKRDLLTFLRFFDKNAKVHPDGGVSCVLATSASSRASVVVREVSGFTYHGDRLHSFNLSYRFEESKVQATDAMELATDNFYFKPDIM